MGNVAYACETGFVGQYCEIKGTIIRNRNIYVYLAYTFKPQCI